MVDEELFAVPPAIPELRRRLLLARLVLRWAEKRGGIPLVPGQAAVLAGSLARLLDRVATDGATFGNIHGLAPENLAAHWQIVVRFLEILPEAWPGVLAAEGVLDPADRRNRLLERQAATWRRSPPAEPVIAAGLIGGIPAMTELLAVVSELDKARLFCPASTAAAMIPSGRRSERTPRIRNT